MAIPNDYSFLLDINTPIEVIVGLFVLFLLSVVLIVVFVKDRVKKTKYIGFTAFLSYTSSLMCHTVIFRHSKDVMEFEPIPFWSYIDIIKEHKMVFLYENFLNIVLFLPLGFFLGFFINDHQWRKVFIISIVLSSSIEIMQLLLHRGLCEFDDVFHNTIGCLLGYIISILILRYDQKRRKFFTVN